MNGQEVGSLTELSQPISIGLPLPQPLQPAGRIVYVVRSHEGKQERLASTVENGVIRFATDQFSEFAIMSSNDLAYATVDPIPNQTWTGLERMPKVRVTITGPAGEETLEEGTDYDLIYTDNVEAGTATVTIKGKNDFDGTSTTVTFRIVKAEAEAITPPADPGSTADGSGSTADDPGNTADSSGSVTDDSGSTADGFGNTTDDPGSVTSFPATGDETPLTLYTWLLVLSAGGLAAILFRREKQQ